MIINQIDLGGSHPWAMPTDGQILGTLLIEGYETIPWPRGAREEKQSVTFTLRAWQALGGQAAFSVGAARYLLKQARELARNRDMQPCYIQWTATAEPGQALNASDLDDGWYVIDDFRPDYANYVVTGMVTCQMTVTKVAPAPPRRVAMAYSGGALASNYNGAILNLITLPFGSTGLESYASRSGAEGVIIAIPAPVASPEPFVLSTLVSNWFKGSVRVYDTLNTGSNPVPTTGGTFVHANWVEVFGTDHVFTGDCVITNGFQLLLFQAGLGQIAQCYVWTTGIATPSWQIYAVLYGHDNAEANCNLYSYTPVRVGPEECALTLMIGTGSNVALLTIRLQRGHYDVRASLRPLMQASTTGNALILSFIGGGANLKIAYNSGKIADRIIGETAPAPTTDYGYGAAFAANSGYPFIVGFLYQNQPGGSQPANFSSAIYISLGDPTSLAINAQRAFGFFAVPYGVSASYSPANLQGEGENFSQKDAGWSSVVDGLASGGNTAKCASGTVSGHSLFDNGAGRSFVPATGIYDVWARLKVTSGAGGTGEMEVGLFDVTGGVFSGSTLLAASSVGTNFVWVKVAVNLTPGSGHTMCFGAKTGATLGTDWFVDEMALVPKSLPNDRSGPQDLWQNFMYDRSTELVVD